ncbi:hypothetical protein F5878DRAFT_666578 [Lentinula raphanica]|uniref:Uncharacterized protein n=1 Tax=Lentinula raphanica TaxID=153919 RepID=A0AA38NXH4_9AGAR|nr:hypothetical protein F5878DRAFT_666578 [Lentinula raphanica]
MLSFYHPTSDIQEGRRLTLATGDWKALYPLKPFATAYRTISTPKPEPHNSKTSDVSRMDDSYNFQFAEANFHEHKRNECSFWSSIMLLLCFRVVAGRRSFSLRENFKIHCQAWASDFAKFRYKTSIATRRESHASHITHTLCSHMKRTLRSDSRKVDSFSVERQHVPPTPVFTATVMEDYRRRLKEAIKTKRLIHFLPGYGMVDFALPLKNDGTMVPIEQKALENYRRTHEFRFPSCLHASNTGMYSETVIRSRRGVLAFACNVKGNFCAYYVPIATLLGAESQVEFEEYDVKTYLGSISTMSALSSPPSAPPDAPQPSTQSISVSMQSPPDSLPQLLSPLEHLPPLLQLPELAPSARSVLLSQPSSEMSFSSQHVEPSFSSQQIESSTASEQVESSTASEQVESSTALEQIEASAYSTRVEASAYSTRVEASASPPWVQLHSLLHNMEHSSAGPSTSLQRLHSFLLAHTLRSSQSPDSAVSTQSSPISPSLRHLPVTPPPPPPPPSQPGSSSRFLDDNHKGKKRAQAPEPLVSTKRIKRFPYQKAVRDRSLSALNATSSTTVATTMVSSNLVFTPIGE